MNRIRHAYLEMVPTLEPYFSTGRHDDIGSVLSIYGASPERPSALLNLGHGLTTMPGMLSVLNAGIAGALMAAVDGRVRRRGEARAAARHRVRGHDLCGADGVRHPDLRAA